MNDSGPGTGPAGRRLLNALDRLDDPVRAVYDSGCFRLEGRGHRYALATIFRLIDAGLVKAQPDGDDLVLRFTAAGRELLGG